MAGKRMSSRIDSVPKRVFINVVTISPWLCYPFHTRPFNLHPDFWKSRSGPCLDFGFQYTLIRNNWSKKFGVEYWALPGSNSQWRPWYIYIDIGWKASRRTKFLSHYHITVYQKAGKKQMILALLFSTFIIFLIFA